MFGGIRLIMFANREIAKSMFKWSFWSCKAAIIAENHAFATIWYKLSLKDSENGWKVRYLCVSES